MFHRWGNKRVWGGISQPLCMLKNALPYGHKSNHSLFLTRAHYRMDFVIFIEQCDIHMQVCRSTGAKGRKSGLPMLSTDIFFSHVILAFVLLSGLISYPHEFIICHEMQQWLEHMIVKSSPESSGSFKGGQVAMAIGSVLLVTQKEGPVPKKNLKRIHKKTESCFKA